MDILVFIILPFLLMAFILNVVLFGGIIYTYNMKTDIPEMPTEEFINYKNNFIKNKENIQKQNVLEEFSNHKTYPNIRPLRRY